MRPVCLLTGAGGLFGQAFVARCAAEYRIVAVHGRTPVNRASQNQTFVDPLNPGGRLALNDDPVHTIRADLSRADEIERVVDETLNEFGQVDLLINAAARRHWAPLLAPGAIASASEVFDVNLLAPLRMSVEVARRCWLADPAGNLAANRSVVQLSSTAGLYVYPDLGQALYGTSKAGLNHLTYHLASEFWDLGVRVNALAPDTFPGRVATQDVIDGVLDLARSDVTGRIVDLTADGG
ncbi:SDR family oxidoreductase [Kineosporia sp. J2-2]|uniref:SDR family oxidoreductase n=1 Tax=Kineosporia corallincola TaxID=2835133 RepID=A0ABS5TG57_9ACTN|nr:SDR family oxidoreductase [Kineosporia corallincola]MBT0769063.1 SDR family oxidoreductase [Kineosporia corallincola]